MKIDSYIKQIKSIIKTKPTIGLVLGSGLGNFVKKINEPCIIDYKDIKNYPLSTVKGHDGRFIFGKIYNQAIICAQGRFHLYEGYDFETTTIPIDIFHSLGSPFLLN